MYIGERAFSALKVKISYDNSIIKVRPVRATAEFKILLPRWLSVRITDYIFSRPLRTKYIDGTRLQDATYT